LGRSYSVRESWVVNEAWSGPGPPGPPRVSASDGLTGAALSARATIRCDDVRSDPRYLTNQETTGPELVAPIIAGGI